MIEANGLRFHVVDEGEGFPVVLLHGFPDTSDLWRAQVEALSGAGLRAIAPDLRGRGRSDRPEAVADYALTAIAADVTGLLDALGLERAHVVGHDWGAAVAWVVASLAPERVERLVPISVGFPGAAAPDLEALQKGWYRLLVLFPEAEELLRRDDWALLRVLLDGGGDVDAAVRELSEPGALEAALAWYRANLPVATIAPGGRPPLPPVQAPTLAIFGTEDRYLTERAMTASEAHVAGPWRYERIEGAGHWIPLERAELLNELLLGFLAAR